MNMKLLLNLYMNIMNAISEFFFPSFTYFMWRILGRILMNFAHLGGRRSSLRRRRFPCLGPADWMSVSWLIGSVGKSHGKIMTILLLTVWMWLWMFKVLIHWDYVLVDGSVGKSQLSCLNAWSLPWTMWSSCRLFSVTHSWDSRKMLKPEWWILWLWLMMSPINYD